jgi:hypothetical protein
LEDRYFERPAQGQAGLDLLAEVLWKPAIELLAEPPFETRVYIIPCLVINFIEVYAWANKNHFEFLGIFEEVLET